MAKESQSIRILGYMNEFGSITPLEAMRDLGVYRLAARIADLRKAGNDIQTTMVDVPNRYGTMSKVAQYRMVSTDG